MTLTQLAEKHNLDPVAERSFVQTKLLSEANYAPYCGRVSCFGRCPYKGGQFQCVRCGWRTIHTDEFISEYQTTWGLRTNK